MNPDLPERMRDAAGVIEEAAQEFHERPENDHSGWIAQNWTARDLRHYADEWEEDAKRSRHIQDLVWVLRAVDPSPNGYPYEKAAEALAAAGWSKS